MGWYNSRFPTSPHLGRVMHICTRTVTSTSRIEQIPKRIAVGEKEGKYPIHAHDE